MEYIIGPVLAVAISIAFSEKRLRTKASINALSLQELTSKIEDVGNRSDDYNKQIPTQVMKTLLPVAKEVSKLKQTVGI